MITNNAQLTREARLARLDEFLESGRLIRGKWKGTTADGRETACLLGALSPEAGAAQNVSACPEDVMPAWLVRMTPWINDAPSDTAWPEIIRRYAVLAHRWHVLSDEEWRCLDYRIRAICVREAMRHTKNAQAIKVCENVIALCNRAGRGEDVGKREWVAAELLARSVRSAVCADALTPAATRAAAGWSAQAAALASASESEAVSEAVFTSSKAAVEAAAEEVWVMVGATTKQSLEAVCAASDRIANATLEEIEEACEKKSRNAR